MTTNKKYLSEPPLSQEVSNKNMMWKEWFNDIHYRLGSRNHQLIEATKVANLDAKYIRLKANSSNYVITLDPPVSSGETKVIELVEKSSTYEVSLSLTNIIGGTASSSCVWSSVRDTLVMVSLENVWLIIKEQGVTLT